MGQALGKRHLQVQHGPGQDLTVEEANAVVGQLHAGRCELALRDQVLEVVLEVIKIISASLIFIHSSCFQTNGFAFHRRLICMVSFCMRSSF
jgi:hypothetical protein